MRSRFLFLLITAVVLPLASCSNNAPILSPAPLDTANSTSSPTRQVAVSPSPSASPPPPTNTSVVTPSAASQTPETDSRSPTQYTIQATLNYAGHHLMVDQQIKFTNPYAEPLQDLLLIVEPSRYPGTFKLNEITWLGDGSVVEHSREIGFLHIPLDEALPPGGSLDLSISYELDLPSPSPTYYGRPVPFGYSSRQTNLVDWYPFIPPYQPGQGWLAHQAGAFGEHLVYELADFTVSIQLTDNNPNLMVAASAPGVLKEGWTQYQLNAARNFSWSVSDQYVLSTTTVDSILVMSYYFPFDSQPGEAVLRTTADSIALYSDLFGPYPRKTLSIVEADFLDGMEYDGLYFLSKGFYNLYSGQPSDYLTSIAAHETAHQWWYRGVGNDQALEPWLDEALSTYSERLFYEHVEPDSLDWWWTYRIDYYDPRGWVDGSIYNPLGYRAYRDAVYLNGARFLEDLRHLIGDQAFLNFLGAYSREYSHQIASGDDFFELLSDHSQADLTPLLEEYFQSR